MASIGNGSILPPEYDDIQPRGYDPAFTADINTKMRVPEALGAAENGQTVTLDSISGISGSSDRLSTADMTVPEKIIYAGQNQHISARADVNIEPAFIAPAGTLGHAYVGLQTPPQVLTINDKPDIPSAPAPYISQTEEEHSDSGYQDSHLSSHPPQTMPSHITQETIPSNELILTGDSETDLTRMKHHVYKLTHQVNNLVEENNRRSQRELFLYPFMMGYFLFKIASWFLKSR